MSVSIVRSFTVRDAADLWLTCTFLNPRYRLDGRAENLIAAHEALAGVNPDTDAQTFAFGARAPVCASSVGCRLSKVTGSRRFTEAHRRLHNPNIHHSSLRKSQ